MLGISTKAKKYEMIQHQPMLAFSKKSFFWNLKSDADAYQPEEAKTLTDKVSIRVILSITVAQYTANLF